MKKVININFQGTIVPIEESAYELLQQYTESLRRYFAEEEGKDEIINDIESRISELFQARLKNGATCITDDDVNAIIDNMGRPADFEKEEGASKESEEKTSSSQQQQQQHWTSGSKRLYRDENNKILGGVCSGIGAYVGIDPWIVRIIFILSGIGILAYLILWIFLPTNISLSPSASHKKLYRNPDDKIIAGVCGGIGSYFDINPWLPRMLFLLPFIIFVFRWHNFVGFSFPDFIRFTFSPGTLFFYIILWLVIPEAKTTSEKLEMKGEKINLDSIKESVAKEMKGVSERVGKMGMEAGEFMKNKGPEMGKEFGNAVNRGSAAIGKIIILLIKIFLYMILACVALAIIVAVFSVAFVAIGIFPLKDFVLSDGWQNILAWLTLIFFIGVPVVGIITYLIRKIARAKSSRKTIRYAFVGLWVFGWICFFALISFVGRDFNSVNSFNEQSVTLSNPTTAYLEIKPINSRDFRWRGWFRMEPYASFGIADDTAMVGNVQLRIVQSPTDSFQVSYIKLSNGSSRQNADKLASLITFTGYQLDSTLYLDNGIAINKTDKFRNQQVEVTIAVPVGKRIKINRTFGYRNDVTVGWGNLNDRYWGRMGYSDYDFSYGEEYIMKPDGLHNINGDWNDDNDDENDGAPYRYKNSIKIDSIKKQHEEQINILQDKIDSTKEVQKNELKQLQDSLQNQRKEIDKKLKTLESKTACITPLPLIMNSKSIYPFLNYI